MSPGDTLRPPPHGGESVTVDERRIALEAMASEPDDSKRKFDAVLLGTIGLASIDPQPERFEGEGTVLAVVVAEQSAEHAFETRILAQAAIEVWCAASAGTAASRTALLRAAGAFLLHDAANTAVLATRPVRQAGEPGNHEGP